jgi:hypothetical protein
MPAGCPLQLIGAGPAGMSLLLALCNRVAASPADATLERELLDSLQVFEAGPRPGGKMAAYRVNANTSSHDVIQGIADGTPFAAVRDAYVSHPRTQNELIPLAEIGRLMVEPLAQAMLDYLGERLHCGVGVARIEMGEQGFASFDTDGNLLQRSDALVLCCGAREVSLPELAEYEDRWEGSGSFLMRDDLDGLADDGAPIVIIGASHSAFSCAWRLLYDPLFGEFARGRDIFVLKRRERIKLRCTPEFAAAHGIEYDPEQDVCPVSGLVFRNAGLRKDAKQLYLDIRDGRETRVRIVQMDSLAEQRELLERASLILQATGFASNLPRIERDGRRIEVGNPTQNGELHDPETNQIVPGLYGMGLGFNIVPEDALGEASFRGGLHGFQSYPLAIAPRIIESLQARLTAEKMT